MMDVVKPDSVLIGMRNKITMQGGVQKPADNANLQACYDCVCKCNPWTQYSSLKYPKINGIRLQHMCESTS
ncbi:unnamed protein product [Leptosia nina]|uniref:Uncharacterized protein n=1 Tax=Leptosia nina TaxID=320188 RepID=A0AAV1K2K4_9NEOP